MGSFTPPPTTVLAPGDRLDRYELLCVLAQGGMGTVWLARITGKHGFERLVAVKTILATYGNDRQFCDMFLDEARIASQVDHENVARILEIGEDRGVLYHAMELVDGESLRKLYRDIRGVGAPFPLAVALRVAADLCSGLHAVHELRAPDGLPLEVVHRDVSPQNILITIRGTLKLIDFGVAKARQRRTEATTAGTLKGKIEYMAPEQATGKKVDRRADVYAVGAVLYELLSGEPVRNTEEGRQLLALHELMTGAPYKPLHASVPLPIRSLVDRALARDPEQRYRTAEDLRHALEQAMITIGHLATSDDVANVLGHFSRERTTRRKEAIDAAVRAASTAAPRESLHTVVTPVAPPLAPPIHTAPPSSSTPHLSPPSGVPQGPRGTQVIATQHISDGSSTGPSFRTMQGAAMSGPAPQATGSAGKTFGTIAVLCLVAVLGVLVGIVASRTGASPAPASTPPAVSVAPTPSIPPPLPPTMAPPPKALTSESTDAAASPIPSASASARRRAPSPPPAAPVKPKANDDYGF